MAAPHDPQARAYRHALHAFLVLLCLAAAMLAVLPTAMGPSSTGMRTPIIAFELARSEAEVAELFGSESVRGAQIAAMDLGNRLDFAFLIAYGAALFLLARALYPARPSAARAAQALALAAVIFDVLENLRLLAITRALSEGQGYARHVDFLVVFTWGKWGAIALAFLSLSSVLWSDKALVARALAVASVFNALCTTAAFFARGTWAELMGSAVPLCFLLGFVLCVQRSALRSRS
ncbi:MAG TPA: hypothetical protein VI072_20390 [Polyangiaceae bacterium]